MTVAVRLAAAMGMRTLRRQIDHMAVAHAALGNDVIGKFLHVGAAALEHRDLHAAVVAEMYVQRRLREMGDVRGNLA